MLQLIVVLQLSEGVSLFNNSYLLADLSRSVKHFCTVSMERHAIYHWSSSCMIEPRPETVDLFRAICVNPADGKDDAFDVVCFDRIVTYQVPPLPLHTTAMMMI